MKILSDRDQCEIWWNVLLSWVTKYYAITCHLDSQLSTNKLDKGDGGNRKRDIHLTTTRKNSIALPVFFITFLMKFGVVSNDSFFVGSRNKICRAMVTLSVFRPVVAARCGADVQLRTQGTKKCNFVYCRNGCDMM